MRRFPNNNVFVMEFPNGVSDVTLTFNKRMGAKRIDLLAVACDGAVTGGHALYLTLDDMSMNCVAENVPGFPIPLVGASAVVPNLGHVFTDPWPIAYPARSALQRVHARITDGNGTAFAHATSTIWVWLRAVCDDIHEAPETQDALKHSFPTWGMSGWTNDTRRDDTPSLKEQAHKLPLDRFSIHK